MRGSLMMLVAAGRVLLGTVIMLAAASPVVSQQSVDISGPPSCSRCAIVLDSIVTLGGRTEREGIIVTGPQVARDKSGRFFLGPTSKTGQIVVYDSTGHPMGSIGDTGAVRFSSVSKIWLDDGDSLHVFDDVRNTHTVLSPEVRVVRSVPFRGDVPNDIVFLPDGSSIQQARVGGSGSGFPVHLMGPDGGLRRSFGADAPLVARGNPYQMYGAIGAAPNAAAWVGNFTRYQFDLLDSTGRLLTRVTRHAPFYPTWSGQDRGPTAFDVRQDSTGYLWVLINDPSQERDGIPQTIIEVLDPMAGRAVSARTVDGFFWRFFAGAYTSRVVRLPTDTFVVKVFRVRLTDPDARSR